MRRACFVMVFLIAMVCAGGLPAAEQEKAAKPKAEAAPASPLNLNTATIAELQALPGVGASTAKLIVAHREKNGGFKKIEELMNIKGIGEKSFLKLKPMVTVVQDKDKSDRQAPKDGKQ